LLGAFISNTEIYLEQAIAAFANNDLETLARRTHQIKGSASTVGVRFMPEIATQVQKYAQQNKPQEIPQLLQQLKELLARVKHWQSNGF
jgi:HPt (histidine-containing phosphotransfer) domain-containing protein